MDDESLVGACRRGDEAAWEALVRRYQRLVYTVPRRAGMDEDAAADVFQRVFTNLFEHLDRLDRPDRLAAWLVTVARRETWRSMRRDVVGRVPLEDVEPELQDTAPLADEVLLRMEEQHAVRSAMAALQPRCRELLGLLFYAPQPIPYAEIAEQLGIAEGSIGPIRGRCLERLRTLLTTSSGGVFPPHWTALSSERQ
jgi:RNA polymerase sigma factor (sigma-70 family)